MGIVCLGRHAQLDQPVAIKFLRRELSGRPSIVARFLNEARALAALRSAHVVRVMDVGQLESGRPYLVMELLDGIDLDALVTREGPLSIETAVSYLLQVCEAIAEAHSLGIVHRDIKPENLFLWSGGPAKDIVKVLDFGLAKRLGRSNALGATGPQESMGSPCYMSPEQIVTPHLVDSRTDIWSIGVVLHRLLTDTLPFEGANLLEVFGHVLNAAPKSMHSVLPTLDTELDAIVRRCLEKEREKRYGTVEELSEALTDYLAHRRDGLLRNTEPGVEAPSPASLPPRSAHADVESEAIALAGRLAALPRVAVASTKRFFMPLINGTAEASDMLANRIFAENCQDDASKATLRKFGMKV
jgi:serine/threonine-protein kinase